MRKTSFWVTTAFVALAGLGLAKGYMAQSKSNIPPKQTAYSYSNGSASGTVGTSKDGLEYKVNFKEPNVDVATKVEDVYANAKFDLNTGRRDFYAESDVLNGEKFKAKASFENETVKTNVNYEKSFKDSWLDSFGLTYTENIGKQNTRKVNAKLTFDFLGLGFLEWTPSYDFKNKSLDFGRIRRA